MFSVRNAAGAALLLFCCTATLPTGTSAQDGGISSSGMSMNPEMDRMWALADPSDATIEADSDGAWSEAATWNLDRIPAAGDRVYIPQGRTIVYDAASSESLHTLRLDGTLTFATDQDTAMTVDTLIGGMQSVLTMGTQSTPVEADHSARLTIKDYDDAGVADDDGFERNDSDSADFDPAMLGLGLITHGRFESAGAVRAHGGPLANAPMQGDTELLLAFTPSGWTMGDEIVIAGTARDALGDEKRTVTAITNRRITLDRPLEKDHAVVDHTKAGLTLAVHVINLSRNVVIETAESGRAATKTGHTYTEAELNDEFTIDLFHDRGHVMFMHSNNVAVRHTRFHALGRTSKHGAVDDNQFNEAGELTYAGINPRARYALHFHRAGLGGSPGLVEGSVVDDTPGWCYVNHGSYADFNRNVAYDCDGAGFVTERGDELGSFTENLSIRNTADEGKRRTALRFQARKPINDFGFGGHGFWFQGINIIARDNVASGAGREAFALYPLLFDNADQTEFTTAQISPAHRASFTGTLAPDEAPLHTFEDNIAYGSNIGLMIGEHRPDAVSLVDGFTTWMVRMGTSFNYSDSIRFDDLTMIGNLDTPEGLGAFAHHGTAQVSMNNAHVEGFAIGIQLPRAGNQAVDLARYKYSAVRDAYLNNVLNLHVLQIRSHDFLHADIERPRFGSLTGAALAHGIQALAEIDQTDDLDIDSSNTRSNGFGELATEVVEKRFTSQQDYYLHYTQTAGSTADTRHQRDGFLPRRITVTDADGKQWRLFFRKQQTRDFIPFPTTVYKAGVDYDLTKPLDRDAPQNNRNSNLPAEFLDKSVAQIAELFQRNATNPHWVDFAWAKDRTGSRWAVDAATDYPGFALVPGGRLLPTDYDEDPRFQLWTRSTNLVAMRVDDLPHFIDYAGRDLELNAQVLDADACVSTSACLTTLVATDSSTHRFDEEPENGRSLLLNGTYQYPAPFSLEHKSFTWHTNLRALDTQTGTLIDAGDDSSGFRVELMQGILQVTLRNANQQVFLTSGVLTAGDWVHVALIVNQGLGEAVLTIDGVNVATTAITPFRSTGGSTWHIGGPRTGSDGEHVLGYIDDMTFSERTYTDAALRTLAATRAKPAPERSTRDADADQVVDTLDHFPLDSAEYQDTDKDGIGNNADTDDDADGIPDKIEQYLGLDPLSADDANEDLDRDGTSNIEEYQSGTRLDVDDVDPWVLAPIDKKLPAKGALTAVDLGVAQAGDARDGLLIASPSPAGPYSSGIHEITWQVSDAAGNQAQAIQTLVIEPQLFVSGPTVAAEGKRVQLTLTLDGEAPSYPVRIPYQLIGSADRLDYSVVTDTASSLGNTLEIISGRQAVLDIDILTDSSIEGDETIELMLGKPEHAVLGTANTHAILLREANIAPSVSWSLEQGGSPVDALIIDAGTARLVTSVSDPNPTDTHSLDWSHSDDELLAAGVIVDNVLSFDVADLSAGSYQVELIATDNGDGQLTGSASFSIVVRDAPPIDGSSGSHITADGMPDPVEDDDNEWLLSIDGFELLLATTPDLRLKPGTVALGAGTDGATLAPEDHALLGGLPGAVYESGFPQYRFAGSVLDVEIHDVAPGGIATLVVPLASGIPTEAQLRRVSSSGKWVSFDSSGNDQLKSLRGQATACPDATNTSYVADLNTGDHCIALQLVDGGDNDSDGVKDGVVRLLFGIRSVTSPDPQIAVAHSAPLSATRFNSYGEHEVLAFTLSSDDIGGELHAIELKASGELDEVQDLVGVSLYADRNNNGVAEALEAVGRGHYAADNATLRFTLDKAHQLEVGENAFLVTYTFRRVSR